MSIIYDEVPVKKTINEPKIRVAVDPANPRYYLDKDAMRDALRQYNNSYREAVRLEQPIPIIPNYLGECFLGIARGYANKYNFRNYSFVNDMIGDAVVTCIKYVKSYDPDRLTDGGAPTSPLAYFTQTCHYAFLGRIAIEAKQSKLKRALVQSADLDTFALGQDDDAADFHMHLNEFVNSLGPDTDKEDKKPKKVVTPKPGLLDTFLE